MITIEHISYSIKSGLKEFNISLIDIDTQENFNINLPAGRWNKSIVINALIRNKYSQDQVEAIINNHFLNISEWLDKKLAGEEIIFEDPEYSKFQEWRQISKKLADEIIEKINSIK